MPGGLASEGDFIYVFSTFGKKIVWMRANPKVCIQIDEIAGQSQWMSVIVNGRYEELPEPQYVIERKHARQLLEKRSQWWLNTFAERQLKLGDKLIEPLFFRICIDSMTGLRCQRQNRGHQRCELENGIDGAVRSVSHGDLSTRWFMLTIPDPLVYCRL